MCTAPCISRAKFAARSSPDLARRAELVAGLQRPDRSPYSYSVPPPERCDAPYICGSLGSVGSMLTMRRSRLRVQKNVADVDENSLMAQPPSIHASIAVMKT